MAIPPSPYVDRIRELQESFQLFDLNRDGTITSAELAQAMRHLGQHLSPEQAVEIVKGYDVNGDGKIEFAEFLLHQLRTLQGLSAGFRAAFEGLDRDRDGFIERDELLAAVRLLWDGKLSDAQVALLAGGADVDGDGRVALGEIVHLIMREP